MSLLSNVGLLTGSGSFVAGLMLMSGPDYWLSLDGIGLIFLLLEGVGGSMNLGSFSAGIFGMRPGGYDLFTLPLPCSLLGSLMLGRF